MSKNKGGRPTKYRKVYDEQVYKLALLGATDEQIADFFEISVQTLHNWVSRHTGFLEARKRGKLVADANVAEALYHRALGFEHDEEKIFQYEGEAVRVATRKKYPPDTAAAFIWLKNRAGWRDKQEVEHGGRDGKPLEVVVTRRLVQPENRVAEHVGANGNGQR